MTMPKSALRTIEAIDPKPGFRLAIVWVDGATSTVDLSSSIAAGGVFAPLKEHALFEKVRIGARRRTIEWPEPVGVDGGSLIDIDADALSAMSSSGQTASAAGSARRRARPSVPPAPVKKHG